MANDETRLTSAAARVEVDRLKAALRQALADPDAGEAERQLCLDAFNAASTELQRLLALELGALQQQYHLDQASAAALAKPLRDLKAQLQAIQSAIKNAQAVIDALTQVLEFVAPLAA